MRRGAQIIAGNVDLDVVGAFAAAQAHRLGDLLDAVGDHAEALVIHVLLALVAEAAGYGDFRTAGAHARSRQAAGIDFVADDDV